MDSGLHRQQGGFDVSALRLDAVLRWREAAWAEFDEGLRGCGFDRTSPGHLAALQWLIDQAYEEDGKS